MGYSNYLMVVEPPEDVENQVSLLKRSCFKHIGKFDGMYSKAHISFGLISDDMEPFNQNKLMINRYFELIKHDLMNIKSHNISIKGFDLFKHGPNYRTIYAALNLTDETMNWFNSIKEALGYKNKFKPHITIARKLSLQSFEILWPYFEERFYDYSFKAEYLTVLIKEKDILYSSYKVYDKIPFLPN